ncbi:SDR family NAD(P)-dependent oxidoreductase, partial [Amycolatopsis cihanbeyliensis]
MQSRQAIRCRVTLDSDNPIVADHRVHGVRSLPGVTFLDLIHRALDARGFPPGRAELRNVLFVEPVVTTEEFGREILLELLPEGTGYRVLATSRRIRDGAAEEHVTRHLEADLHLGELPRAVAPPVAGLPPATEQVDVQRVYQLGRAVGVRHEEFMRCTGTIHVYPEGLLAEIELSAQGRADVAEFLLHPALLDSATMQSYLLAFAPGGEQDDRPLIPIHIESFRAYGGLGDACLVWLRPCGAVTPDADVLFVDIDLLDRQHRPLARFGKLAFKRVRSEALFTRLTEEHAAPVEVERAPEPVAPAPGADLRAEITEAVRKVLGDPGAPVDGDRGFYELGLESMHLLQLVRELEQRFSVRLYPTLLFEYSTVDAVAGHLETLVDRSTVPTVPAVPAAATREVEPEPRTVRLAGRWQPAQSANVPQWTGRLLVLGASEPPGLTDEDLFARPGPEFRCTGPGRYELRAGVAADHRRLFAELDRAGTPPEAVVHLGCAEQGARAVEDAAGELLLLARQLAERTGQRVPLLHASPPELAETLPGLARTVTLEHPRIPATVLESAEVPPVEVLRAELAREETWVRRAGGRRWVRRYAEASDEQAGRPGPRAGGVYLISGGTGALGLAFAGFLTRTVGARVVLFGRSEPDAATEQRLRELGQVRFVRADVTDPADARRVVAEARQHFGPVDGVIHAAGTLADSLLAGKDLDELHRVLAPKVRGTINLDEATRSEPLDFFALFSSVTGTIGNIGQADYAVANAFLAGYAARRERFLAVGWPLWLDGGMSADETALARFREQGQLPLPEAAGIEAFRAALAGPERDVLVFHGDPERIRSSYDLRPVTESVTEPVSAEPVTGPRPVSEEDIAIIGLAGRYPMAEDLDQLWANLLAGRDAVTEVPAERWSQRDFYAAERNTPGRSHSKWGGFLADADRFDPRFFQITPREAEAMDPQERLFLEAVWHTLEDAGYPATRLAGSATGVFAGVMFNQYQLLGLAAPEQLPVLPTSFSSSVANRVSYFLDLHGPSLGLDTMCSSSLTAIHLACQSLRSGDCELAFAGGVNVSVHPYKYLYLSQAGFTSSDGRCRSFGEGGDGYVPGEGVGSVLLKPLSRALADGDRVHAVIRGSAVNHGGRAGGYTVPNPTAQAEVLDAALASSGVDPDTISYIEAHGTGTSLGDPIELAALGKVFGTGIPRPIGSIKSNIGHLEPAAGIAGLTKVLLQLRHRTLVPSLHADPPNPAVDWAATPLRVQRTVEPWAADGVRRAGVSAFGAGGANGHLVLEEFVPPAREEPTPAGPQLVLLSARTEENLRGLAGRYAEFLAPATGGERDVTGDLLAIGAELFGPAVTTVGPDAALAEWGVDTADLLRFEQRIGERFGELPPRPGLDSTVADLAAAVSPSSTVERSGPELADIAYTTQVGRDSFAERLALVVTSTDELRERLRGFAGGGEVAHRGTVTRGAEAPDPERALAERDLDELARLWTAGAAPDWHRLHRGSPVRRVGLPLYPFTRLRCWVSTPDTQAPAGPRPEEQDTDFLHIPGWQATEPPAGTRDDAPVLVLHTPANRWLAEELAARLPGARLADLGDEPANPPPRTVYFLGGVLDGTAALDEAEPAGVLALARWARYLTAERGLSWKVVLAGGNPYTGGLAGFARVLERECPTWTVAVHELDDPRARLDALLAEPAARGARIRHTAEGRYRQVLRPAPPAAGEQAPIRGGGVYVIAGGSGGIGLEMARFLARDHRARVVLLGRREPDAELRGRIAEADPDGGLIEYLRADASDQEALRAARQRIRDRHGPVNGVIHAALVRQERLVRNLDEPALRASLAAKSGVAVALAEVFGGPELDFLLLFSSAQSFLGDAGLAGYAAGSTFLDGYAAALANRLPCRVRVINWGYWGTVGSVADESSRQQLTREGFRSISPELGRRVVLRALSGDAVQLVAVPAEEPLRRRLGTAREEQDALLTRPLAEAEAAAIDGFHALDAELAGAASDWLLRILDELGAWRGTAGEEVSEQDIAGRVGLTARYTGLLGKILRLLTGAGLLRAGEHGYAPLPEPLRRARSGDQQAELDALERRHPEFAVFVRLLALCLSHYPELLRGELLATDLLFPSSGTSLMEAVYKGNAISDVYNDILNDTVLGYVEGRLPGLAAGEKIRILEVGSGTGGTTAGLLRTLARHGAHLEYHYTDLSVTFLEHGKREFGRHYDFLRFTRLDADRDLAAQGLPPGGFDLVIGANVVHATPNLARTLGNLRAALRPDGWLVLNELTTVTVQATVSYGLFDGWWAHDDGQRRLPGSPLLDAEGWREHLTGAGYPEVTALPAAAESTRNFQHVIVARGGAAPATGAASPAAKREAPTGAFARDLLALTSEVSGIPVADLDPEQDLGDVGFDSVSYTLLAQRLNERFAFDVTPTLFYETPNLRALTERLGTEYAQALHGRYAEEPVDPAPVPATTGPAPEPATVDEPLAVVGMAGTLPGSTDLEDFWRRLVEGEDLISELPADRWDWRTGYAEVGADGPVHGRWGGFIEGVAEFDPLFFGISPGEAEQMDPQQRLFLQATWTALENAGIAPGGLAGSDTGVFVGVGSNDYQELQQAAGTVADSFTVTANSHAILPNRISYLLDLHGPSEPVNTGCSASLVAVHRAAESIRHGECDLAVAGGINLILSPRNHVLLSRTGMLSQDGRCRTFDAAADGFVRGEGAGAVVLMTKRRAEAGGHRVLAWLRSSAVNHGGRARSLTAPNPASQAKLLVDAYRKAEVDPATVSYVQCHGTGTELGDPVEVGALTSAFRELSPALAGPEAPEPHCALGAVKTAIGHLESAAGIAGMLTVLLALRHGELPGTPHLERPNPYLRLAGGPFHLLDRARPWRPVPDEHGAAVPRRAGVSSFGFGGVNAHVVLEEVARAAAPPARPGPFVFPLSARTGQALHRYAAALESFLEGSEHELADIAHTLQAGRDAMEHRLAVVAGTRAELSTALTRFRQGQDGPGLHPGQDGDHAATAGPEELAARWAAGAEVEWPPVPGASLVPLPTYPFERRRCWQSELERSAPEPEPAPELQAAAEPEPAGLYLPGWVPVPRPEPAPGDGPVWVVHGADSAPLAEALAAALAPRPVRLVTGKDALEALPEPESVYVLTGVGAPRRPAVGDHLATLAEQESAGLLPLYRVARHLLSRPGLRRLTLTVVTARACAVGDSAVGNPAAAQLLGFARSLRRESPLWTVSAVDLDSADPAEAAAVPPAAGSGDELAHRGGTWYRRALEPWTARPGAVPLRTGGSYLIVGGAGSIGLDVAEHLVRRYRARVALLGLGEL